MSAIAVGMLIGAICGSLLTAAYLGICLKEQDELSGSWIDKAIERAFSSVEDSLLEDPSPLG